MSDSELPPAAKDDVLLVHSVEGEGEGARYGVLRAREGRLEAGVVAPAKEGAPLHGELIRLSRRDDSPLYDVTVDYSPPATRAARQGPAQVATPSYREGWDRVFGSKSAAN
jgi:hypothetical protein